MIPASDGKRVLENVLKIHFRPDTHIRMSHRWNLDGVPFS